MERLYSELAKAGKLDYPTGGSVMITASHHAEFFTVWFFTNSAKGKVQRYLVKEKNGQWLFEDADVYKAKELRNSNEK